MSSMKQRTLQVNKCIGAPPYGENWCNRFPICMTALTWCDNVQLFRRFPLMAWIYCCNTGNKMSVIAVSEH